MATLDELLRDGTLEPYQLAEWETRQPIWRLLIASSFWNWFDGTDALHDEKQKIGARTIGEHIEQTFCDLRCNQRPSAGDLRRMVPNRSGIWKIHPAGARLYGWACGVGQIVVVTGATETETKQKSEDKKQKSLNDQKRDEVKKFIKDHKLQGTVLLGDILAIYPPPSK